jgi:hypothetical protein
MESGMLTTGAGLLEITSVAFCVIEPDESLAVMYMETPVTTPVPASSMEGVPDKVRVLLSRDSQLGPLESVYTMGRVDEKVEIEKV